MNVYDYEAFPWFFWRPQKAVQSNVEHPGQLFSNQSSIVSLGEMKRSLVWLLCFLLNLYRTYSGILSPSLVPNLIKTTCHMWILIWTSCERLPNKIKTWTSDFGCEGAPPGSLAWPSKTSRISWIQIKKTSLNQVLYQPKAFWWYLKPYKMRLQEMIHFLEIQGGICYQSGQILWSDRLPTIYF